MNTTIIKANKETRRFVVDFVANKLHKTSRPVSTFNWMEEDTMVVSGCSITELASSLPSKVAKRITWLHSC